MHLSVVKEGRGSYAVVDWDRHPGSSAAVNTVLLFRTERDAQQFMFAAQRAKEA